jgi:hypothetical protein
VRRRYVSHGARAGAAGAARAARTGGDACSPPLAAAGGETGEGAQAPGRAGAEGEGEALGSGLWRLLGQGERGGGGSAADRGGGAGGRRASDGAAEGEGGAEAGGGWGAGECEAARMAAGGPRLVEGYLPRAAPPGAAGASWRRPRAPARPPPSAAELAAFGARWAPRL